MNHVDEVLTSGWAPRAASAHDHVWRRGHTDARTNMIKYTCDLCVTIWTGPKPRGIGDALRQAMIR